MRPVPQRDLIPYPPQPDGVPWPADTWPEADPADLGADADALGRLVDELVGPEPHPVLGSTYGFAAVHRGRLVVERYGERVVQDLRGLDDDPPFESLDASSELLSWSMAKSITSLAVGIAVADGRLSATDPVDDPQWQEDGDPRAAITWHDLLTMRPGLAWREEYVLSDGDDLPDVITMLFGDGKADMAAFAASFPPVAAPGTPEAFTYSSGTTNIVAGNLQRVLGLDATAMDAYLRERITNPLGITTWRADYDEAGTFIGSSYVWLTLRDWARFGLLTLRGGSWDGTEIVPSAWMDDARTARSWDEDILHGAHWWTWDQDQMPFGAHGFEGQRVIAFPTRDLVLIRLGRTDQSNTSQLNAHLTRIAACFPER